MSNAMQLFAEAPVPAHVAAAFADAENVIPRETTPALTFRGKTWRVRVGGEETVLTRRNSDGEAEPTPVVKVVVLNVNQKRSRIFYAGAYVEGTNASPACWSSDGERPDKDVKEPCATTCASCPNSVKGSKITPQGKEVTACGTVKRLVVVPSAKMDMTPLLLKVPQTSMWDKNNAEAEAKGYYAWDQYVDFLRARGVKHTASVVTKVKFDSSVAYPKLLFTAERWLDEVEAQAVVPLVNSDEVVKLMSGKINESTTGEHPAPAPTAPTPPPQAAAASTIAPRATVPAPAAPAPVDDDDDGGFNATPATPTSPGTKPIKTPRGAAAPVPPAPPAPPAPPKVPATTGAGNPDLAALAAAWDD